jgi:hypothetical protein
MGGSGKNESGTRLTDTPLGLLGLRATPGNCRPAGRVHQLASQVRIRSGAIPAWG